MKDFLIRKPWVVFLIGWAVIMCLFDITGWFGPNRALFEEKALHLYAFELMCGIMGATAIHFALKNNKRN